MIIALSLFLTPGSLEERQSWVAGQQSTGLVFTVPVNYRLTQSQIAR